MPTVQEAGLSCHRRRLSGAEHSNVFKSPPCTQGWIKGVDDGCFGARNSKLHISILLIDNIVLFPIGVSFFLVKAPLVRPSPGGGGAPLRLKC